MALYPTKVLLDKNKRPFIPFVTAESILFNNTDKSLADMLYNRYTKEEVDNIIRNLGTIQVLRGRVNTYEDLLAIENPQAGDVYIVGTSNTNNAEYIYIGTTWEELGPMVDLSNLVTIDDLIARLGVYATIEYVDNLIGNVPSLTKPYIELTGTASAPVIIGELEQGFYLIHGVYDTGSSVINAPATGDLLQVGVWNTSTNTRTVVQMKSVNGTYGIYKIDRTFEVTVVSSDDTSYNATFKIKPEYSSTLKTKITQYADKLQKIYNYLEAHPTMYSTTSNINDGNYQWVVDMDTIATDSVTVYLGYLAAGSRTSQTGGGYSVHKNHGFSIIAQCYGTNSGRLRVWAGTTPSYSAYPPSGTSNLKTVTISFSDGNITGYSGPTSYSSSIVWIDQTIAEGDAGRTVVAYVNRFYFLPNPVTANMYHQRLRIKHTGWDVNTYAEYDVPINLNGKVYWGTDGDGPDYYNQTIPYSLFRQCLQTPYDPTTYNYLSNEGQMVTTLSHTIPTNLVNGTASNSIKNRSNSSSPGSYSTALANATASGTYALASGRGTQATGGDSAALGYYAKATGGQSFACNRGTASGSYSHASGYSTTASGSYSSASGYGSQASNTYAHAEGYYTQATSNASHAEGYYSEANGTYSHAEGDHTIAGSTQQHVQGRYNIADTGSVYAHIVGNGTSSARSNAHTLDWNGNAWYAGRVTGSDPIDSYDFVTKHYFEVNKGGTTLSGTGAPTNDMGNDGDIYIQVA